MSSETELKVGEAYARLAACADPAARVGATARLLLAVYDDFYSQLCEYPHRAQRAFEAMDPHTSLRISQERLGLYSRYIEEHGPRIAGLFPALAADAAAWDALDRLFMAMIVDRYDADIAFSFAHSIRRNIGHGLWRPVAYSFPASQQAARGLDGIGASPLAGAQGASMPSSCAPYCRCPISRYRSETCKAMRGRVADRVLQVLGEAPNAAPAVALDVIEAGFFRDRRAFIVGRWILADDGMVPFVVALQNGPKGIYADAVLHRVSDIHDLFSSALANFHVTTRLYYQTCVFLFSLMPRRPFGHQYSTIGFNHVGKVAILNEITEQVRGGHRLAALARRAGHRRARLHLR